MPKRKLSELNPESQEYWEVVLGYHGLRVNRGRNTSKEVCVGTANDLVGIERARVADRVGGGRKVKAKGSHPE